MFSEDLFKDSNIFKVPSNYRKPVSIVNPPNQYPRLPPPTPTPSSPSPLPLVTDPEEYGFTTQDANYLEPHESEQLKEFKRDKENPENYEDELLNALLDEFEYKMGILQSKRFKVVTEYIKALEDYNRRQVDFYKMKERYTLPGVATELELMNDNLVLTQIRLQQIKNNMYYAKNDIRLYLWVYTMQKLILKRMSAEAKPDTTEVEQTKAEILRHRTVLERAFEPDAPDQELELLKLDGTEKLAVNEEWYDLLTEKLPAYEVALNPDGAPVLAKLINGRGLRLLRIKQKKSKKKGRKKRGNQSLKYKRTINCKRPKGFSQKQYCKYKNRK